MPSRLSFAFATQEVMRSPGATRVRFQASVGGQALRRESTTRRRYAAESRWVLPTVIAERGITGVVDRVREAGFRPGALSAPTLP